jgi:hypothetical protein
MKACLAQAWKAEHVKVAQLKHIILSGELLSVGNSAFIVVHP